MKAIGDGSSRADRGEVVRIETDEPALNWRYTCPRGHQTIDPTNRHYWCTTCARQERQGDDIDPEYYHIVDQKTGEEIHWSRVELV